MLTYHLVKRMLKGLHKARLELLILVTNTLWIMISAVSVWIAYEEAVITRRQMRQIERLAGFLNAGCSDVETLMPKKLYEEYYR